MEHEGAPETCPACKESTRMACIHCGHALTGEFDERGHTTCQWCWKVVWIGVGDYND